MTFHVRVLQTISDVIEVFLSSCENDFIECLLKIDSLFFSDEMKFAILQNTFLNVSQAKNERHL